MRIQKPRSLKTLNGDLMMSIDLSDGRGRIFSSMNRLEKGFSRLPLGRHLQEGGSLSVPVRIYIKSKQKMVSVETEKKLKEELIALYKEHIAKGHTADAAAKLIYKERIFHKYWGFRGSNAELIVKTAVDKILQKIPSLSISSVFKQHVWPRSIQCILPTF